MSVSVRHFECLACGSQLEFTPGKVSTHCTMCDDARPLPLRLPAVAGVPPIESELNATPIDGHRHFRCGGCGVLLSAAAPPSACPHCRGTPQPTPVTPLIPPHGWLPSLVEAVQAKAMLAAALGRYRIAEQPGPLSRVWIPWLVFDTVAEARYDGEIGHWVKQGDNSVLEWTPTAGEVERHFEHRMRCASRSLPEALASALEPFDWAFAEPLSASSLAADLVERTEVPPVNVFKVVIPNFEHDLSRACADNIGGDDQRVHQVAHVRRDDAMRLILVPVWLGALPSGTRVAVNGRTGEACVLGHSRPEVEDDFDTDSLGPPMAQRIIAYVVVAIVLLSAAFVGLFLD